MPFSSGDGLAASPAGGAALDQALERFDATFGEVLIGSALVSAEPSDLGRYVRVNPTFCKITGYSEQELLATDLQSITHPDDIDASLCYLQQMAEGNVRSFQVEKRYLGPGGNVVHAVLSATGVAGEDGRPS